MAGYAIKIKMLKKCKIMKKNSFWYHFILNTIFDLV